MKRLDQLESTDPTLRQAQQLLSSVEPLAASTERMWRVRRSLEEKRAARCAGWRGWTHGPRALGLAALLLLVGGGSTLAAAQSGALTAMIARAVQVIQLAPASAPPAAKRAPARRAEPGPALRERTRQPVQPAPPSIATPDAAATTGLPASTLTPTIAVVHPSRHAGHAAKSPRTRAVQARADNEAVRRAVKALRRDGDPALAAKLLEEAHQNSPDGALAEEVMSLRVEAALALAPRDGRAEAKARGYAREYLARYPQGRYRAEVERALR